MIVINNELICPWWYHIRGVERGLGCIVVMVMVGLNNKGECGCAEDHLEGCNPWEIVVEMECSCALVMV